MDTRTEVAAVIGLIVLVLLLLVVGPLITIWSLNTLFGLNIPTNFWTWIATAWLCILFSTNKYNKEKK